MTTQTTASSHCATSGQPTPAPLLVRACRNESTERPPVWMMRQAGRYMAEYQAIRRQSDFMAMCQSVELAAEISLQPYRAFAMDGVILFSDILTIPHAMGLGLSFSEGVGPQFARPIRHADQIADLIVPDPNKDIAYVPAALKALRSALADDPKTALIGFSGAPWTLAAYMIEGGSSKHFERLKRFQFEQPQALAQLLDKLADAVLLYLNAQIEAGAQVVQLFDTWAGILSRDDYRRWVLPYHQKIIAGLRRDQAPVILYVNNSRGLLDLMAEANPDVISVDHQSSLTEAREQVGRQFGIQGNLDPIALFGRPDVLKAQTLALLSEAKNDQGGYTGYVFNLGHGILPQTPVDNVRLVVERVKAAAGNLAG